MLTRRALMIGGIASLVASSTSAMTDRRIKLPYAPRQVFKPYHDRQQRWACLVAHRRCGKTVACINDLIRRAVLLARDHGRYAYVAPYLAQAKETAWEYLKRYAQPIIVSRNESELWVELVNGARIRVHGTDNPDRLRGPYLDGVVLDEYADMRPSVWGEVIGPMLADYQGWATFIGTPKGHNEFYEIWRESLKEPEQWFSATLRASETHLLDTVDPQSGLTELETWRRKQTLEQFEQEFECSFEAAILGAYFGKEIAQAERDGRITDVPHEAALPVHTAWDLGKGANMAVWLFQVHANEIRIIDHIEGEHDDGIPHIVDKLRARPYRYGVDYVPHDARVAEIGTGRTRIETLTRLHRTPNLVPDHKIMDGINGARLTLPRCWFDRTKCADGLEALRQYRADFDEKTKAFRNEPKHDWTSHSADAFRYLAMAWRQLIAPAKPKEPEPMRGIGQITVQEFIDSVAPPRVRV